MFWLAVLVGSILLGSLVYCVLILIAVRDYLAQGTPVPQEGQALPGISILKPLHGADEGLEENLLSFFHQDYPAFEILFAARDEGDAGLAIARRLAARFPDVHTRFLVTGEPPYANAKVYSLECMMRAAAHDLTVMSDSDIRVTPDLLRVIAAEFADPSLGVATCPYRAVPGASVWSLLEAIGMNTEFWGGALTARLVEKGVRFAVGPTIAARRGVIESVGGWPRLSRYLAEDFVLGQFAAEQGHGVILSAAVIEHRIGSQGMRANFAHRLRWNRSTRRSRPAGYAGQVFTNPVPWALILVALHPPAWPVLPLTALLRAAAAHAVSGWALRDPLCRRFWYLIPWQDLLSFFFWVCGFFGHVIAWRGRRYRLHADGTFSLIR